MILLIFNRIQIVLQTEYNGATEFVIEDNNGFILHFSGLDLLKDI